MLKTTQMAVVVLLAVMVPQVSQGEIILSYTGQQFTDISGTAFDEADRVIGTVTFDAVGDTAAKSFSLSTTVGQPQFTLLPDDVSSPPAGITLSNNEFTWDNSLPDTWHLEVFGNINGEEGDEQIGISNEIGDLAAINLGFGSLAATSAHGEWTVVPEPSSLACTAVMFAFVLLGVWRKRRLHS